MSLKYCPTCQSTYPDQVRFCENDSQLLSLHDPYHMVGRVLNQKYRIDALIGVGGMGAVYSAHNLATSQRIAFKILLPHLSMTDKGIVKLFKKEAATAGSLSHENIVDIKDAGTAEDDIAYIAMEWLEGHTLQHEIENRGPFSYERVGELLRQIVAALDAAHAKRVIHRDLKPSNIMLVKRADGSERLKVVDFGIAKIISDTTASPVSKYVGTPVYASPEQFSLGEYIDRRADIYSLGVILYELLSGHLPYRVESIGDLIGRMAGDTPPPLRQFRPDAPLELDGLLKRMLARDPAERPQSASDVMAAYEKAVRSISHLETSPEHKLSTADGVVTATLPVPPSPETAETHPPTEVQVTEKAEADGGGGRKGVGRSAEGESSIPPSRKWSFLFLVISAIALLLLIGILFNPNSIWSRSGPQPGAPAGTSVADSRPTRLEAFRYHLEVSSRKGNTRDQAGDEPLTANQMFRFHIVPREAGYLYIVAPDAQNVDRTFLTALPQSETGVRTNRVEAGVDYVFPRKMEIGITPGESKMAFTFILSQSPLEDPTFLAQRAGKPLSATERHELTLLRQRIVAGQTDLRTEVVGNQSVVTLAPTSESSKSAPVLVDVTVRTQ